MESGRKERGAREMEGGGGIKKEKNICMAYRYDVIADCTLLISYKI